MDGARWEHIKSVFHDALAKAETDRRLFVESACQGDRKMMAEILAMLKADATGSSLLDAGLIEIAWAMVGAPTESISMREFGPYRLKEVLGEGGMGVVWLAGRSDTGNPVAIKFLPHAGLSPVRRDRFTREIRTLARLRHQFIARLYDAGTLPDGTPWFAMEYVDGVNLTEYWSNHPTAVHDQLRLFRSVCDAVRYAHGQEIIHRDLKPSNILVEKDGTPKLLDFGIARQLQQTDDLEEQTRPGLRFISPDYAAPEWARDGIVGPFTDVYSLGVILYRMLAGILPADRSNPRRPSTAVNDEEAHRNASAVAKPSRAEWNDLDTLCLKAIDHNPAHRYQSVEALIRDIDHYLRDEPLEAKPDSWRYRTAKFVSRNRRRVIAASAAFLIVAGQLLFFTVRLARARDAAVAEAARTERIQQFMLNLFQGDDKDAGPAGDLRVVTLIDRGVAQAPSLKREPEVQADLYQTLGTMY
jgi:serine/threonine-protein kinase